MAKLTSLYSIMALALPKFKNQVKAVIHRNLKSNKTLKRIIYKVSGRLDFVVRPSTPLAICVKIWSSTLSSEIFQFRTKFLRFLKLNTPLPKDLYWKEKNPLPNKHSPKSRFQVFFIHYPFENISQTTDQNKISKGYTNWYLKSV